MSFGRIAVFLFVMTAVLGGGHYYLYVRLVRDTALSLRWARAGKAWLGGMPVLLVLGLAFARGPRAFVAPLYLVGSVVISYFAALGLGVLAFQFILGQQLHWSVPPLAFVVLVAVGADYNMLIASRMRDDPSASMRYGIIRTLGSTGGVITAAGLIFAASMAGLLFSSIGTVVQGGFVIGVGILLDTFVVRTITVPAIATLVGRASWWPAPAGRRVRREKRVSTAL